MSQWVKCIDQLPKESGDYLITDGYVTLVAKRLPWLGRWSGGDIRASTGWEPTHWMPLPKPPAVYRTELSGPAWPKT